MYSKDKILLLHSLGFFVSIYSLKSVKIQFLESENKFGLFSKLPLLYFIGILLIIISIYLSFISQNKLFLTYQIFVCNLVIWWTPQLVSSYPIVNDSYAHSALIASMSSFPSKSGYYTYLNFPLFFTSNYYFLFNLTGIDFEYEMILFYYLNSCITNICLFLVIYKIQSKDISKSNKSFFTFSLFNFYSFHYTSPIAFAYPLFIFALYFNFKIFNFENHKLELDENFKFLLIIELFLLYAQPTQAVLLLILSCSNFLVIGLLNRKYKLIDFQKQADISAKKIIMITIIIITFILLIYGIFFPRNLYSIYAIIFKAHPLEFLAYTINIVNITSFHSDRIAPFIKLLVIVIQNLIIIRFLYRIIRRKIFQANVWMLSMYTGSIIFLVLDNLFFRWGNNSNRVFYIWSLLFCLIISNNENITYIKIHVKIGKTFNINTKIFKMKHFFGVCILILVVFSLQIGI
ncbi:MAG: hypothetical protein OEY49_08065, partial [Candidatus Heimdallarchaeota archaeon]|nr:hypothetical protein [Candidatus Heimdallarchaeota archaeon]